MEQTAKDQQFDVEVAESHLRNIEDFARTSGDNSNLESDAYKNLKAQVDNFYKQAPGQSEEKAQAKATQEKTDEEVEEEEEKKEEKPDSKQDKKSAKNEKSEEDEDKNDVFGIKRKTKDVAAKYENLEELNAFIEKKYAIKDPSTLFKSVDKWRNDAQEYSKVNEELNEIKEGLASLPVQIQKAIQLWSNGNDWEGELTTGRIDYTKSFDQQKQEVVLNYYFSEKYKALQDKLEAEKISEDAYDEVIANYLDSAKRLYETDKKDFEEKRAKLIKDSEERTESLKKSAVSSVEKLREEFPDLKQSEVQRARQTLINGDFNSLFLEKNGKYAEDAAIKVALVQNYKAILAMLSDAAENRGKSKATEEIVFNAEKTITKSGKNESPEKKQQIEATQHLNVFFKPDPYA